MSCKFRRGSCFRRSSVGGVEDQRHDALKKSAINESMILQPVSGMKLQKTAEDHDRHAK